MTEPLTVAQAAVKAWEASRDDMIAFEQDDDNNTVLSLWRQLAEDYNMKLEAATSAIRDEVSTSNVGRAIGEFRVEPFQKGFTIDRRAFLAKYPHVIAQRPQLVKDVNPMALQAAIPGVYAEHPEVIDAIDVKLLAKLVTDGHIDEQIGNMIDVEIGTRAYAPKALMVNVKDDTGAAKKRR